MLRPRRRSPGGWCCFRPPARPSTSSGISRRGATPFAWRWRPWHEDGVMSTVHDSIRSAMANRLGRSDRSALGRWFWEIDRVLLLLVAVLISIALIAVAAAPPAAGARYSGGNVTFAPLYYFYPQLMWIIVAVPVMGSMSMLPKERRPH